ncbi:MAG: hypothetical protein LBI13_07430 [Streptococcaceae bacterium]|jgi:hypothetical protein|nr:hypothetical protein [Streptococcaceae bacterium]
MATVEATLNDWNNKTLGIAPETVSDSVTKGFKDGLITGGDGRGGILRAWGGTENASQSAFSKGWQSYKNSSLENLTTEKISQYIDAAKSVRINAGMTDELSAGRVVRIGQNALRDASSAVDNDFSSGIKGTVGKIGGTLAKGAGGTVVGITISSAIDIVVFHKPADEAIGNAVVVGTGTALATAAAVAIFGVAATAFLPAVAIGVGVGIANSLLRNIPAVRDFENNVGKGIVKAGKAIAKKAGKVYSAVKAGVGKAEKWVGQKVQSFWDLLTGKKDKNDSKPEKKSNSRDNYEKSGRLKIQRGGSYSGGQFIALDSDQVNALASTISSKSSDYAQKLIAINNSIDQEIADKLKEVRSWAMGKLGQYNYLTADDVDEILANFTITYDAGAVASSNQKIKTLAQNLAQVSAGLQTAAKTMSSTDDSQAQGFKALPSPASQYKLGFK